MVADQPRLEIFVCYSRADATWLQRVQVHLEPLDREGRVKVWSDTQIQPGEHWREEIRGALARAKVAVLLISADFYFSKFIAENELPPLLQAERQRGLVILCVHVGPSRFERDPVLSAYQSINSPSRSIRELTTPRRERIFDDLARTIENLLSSSVVPHSLEGRLFGNIPNLPRLYVAQLAHYEAVRNEILDTATTGVTMIGARKGTSLVGMGGVGKTTLAAALVRDQEIQQAFPDGICWLNLGQEPDVLGLQHQLLAWIAPGAEPPNDLQEARNALVVALNKGRWLIVLDDLWRREHLRAFELVDTPSRLLVTTRDYEIARNSGAATRVIDELTDSASRAILAKAVDLPDANLPPAAAEVIRECGGLPLALAMAGATLAEAPRDEALWRDVVSALGAADHEQLQADFDYPYPHALAAIQASVDFLPPDDRKAYLQLAIFPEDVPIPFEPLEKLWGVTGLALRNRVKLFLGRALARHQDDRTIFLHDLQHDFVRKRCANVPATHEGMLQSYRPDEATSWSEVPGDGYLIDWLPYHLVGAGRGDECSDLLFDLAWLRRKLAARDVHALIADTGLRPGDTEVQRLGRMLRMSAHVLNRDQRQLPAQLLGRLRKEDGSRTARLLHTAKHEIPAGVLIPRGGKHLLSPGALVQTFEGHSGGVGGAVVMPEEAHALSWSSDRTLRLWDLDSGASRAFEGHGGGVGGAVLLADGARSLSWSSDGVLRLWDLESGASRALEGHGSQVSGAVLLADGERALSWSRDATLRLWDLGTGASRVFEGHSGRVDGAVLLAGGERALSWSGDKTLRLWDLETGASRALEGHRSRVNGAAVLPDGTRALSWSGDGTLRLWDLESDASRTLKWHRRRAGAVLLADGQRALSWSWDGTLRLWDLESGASRALEGHSDSVSGAVVFVNGERALSWSRDKTLRLWDLETCASRPLEGHSDPVSGAVVFANGEHALSWSWDNTLRLWDLESGASRVLEGHSGHVHGAAVLADGRRALSWSRDGSLRLWNLESSSDKAPERAGSAVSHAVLLADCRRALSWSRDGILRLWDLESGASRVLEGHSDGVNGAVLLADGERALSWSSDTALRLWGLESGASRALEGHSGQVSGAVLLADGERALSWSWDKTLRLWDLETGASRVLEGHSDRVDGAVLLADGQRALSWSWDGTSRLWDLESGASRELGEDAGPFEGGVLVDGQRALSWSEGDELLNLWDLESGASRTLEGHKDVVEGAALLAEGQRALSWSWDGTLRLWDLESGASRVLEGHSKPISGAVFADGQRVLSWSWDGTLRLWDLESGASRVLEGHSGWVDGAVLLAGGERALSWSWDKTLRLWNLSSLEELARFVGDAPLTGCVVSADRRLAVAGDSRGRVMCFDLPA